MKDVVEATIREYSNGSPVSREIALEKNKYGFLGAFLLECRNDYVKTGKKSVSDVPSVEQCFQIRLVLVSGVERTLYIYAKEKKAMYIEEPRLGIYCGRTPKKGMGGFYGFYLTDDGGSVETYMHISLFDAFGRNKYSILPEYNGANKAIFMEFVSGGEGKRDPLWRPSHYIPKTRKAERAEDVRYIFAVFDEQTVDGYWRERGTGKYLGPTYKSDYTMVIYDLVNMKDTTIYSGRYIDPARLIEEYFSQTE